MDYIKIGIEKGYIKISENEKKITYVKQDKTYTYTDPEEKVRAVYYVELIEKYQYKPELFKLEHKVPRRTPNDWADIVIFKDTSYKTPVIVVECKREDINTNEFTQAIEQAFGNANSLGAKYTIVVAGETRRAFEINKEEPEEREKNIIADIPINFGKVQEFRYKKGDPLWDIQPVNKQQLIKVLEKCNDTLWDGGKQNPIDAFDELSKIIFIKTRDEKKARKKGDPYDFQIKTHEPAQSVFNRITKLYAEAKKRDPEVFTDNIKVEPAKLLNVVNYLQGINLTKTDLDTKGVAFERFMEDFFKGKQGQYFTPREIVSFIINLLDITNEMKVLDPACGSGGFLLHALDEIRKQASEYYEKGTAEHHSYWHDFAKDNLYGIEVSERIARVAKMNMIIHDDGHTNVICSDALEKLEKIQKINPDFKKNYFDLIITNPPFGATVKLDEKPYLSEYFFGKNKQKKERKSQKTEILFIERIWEFLQPNGKVAIILPDGILTNKTLKYVREYIIDKFEIEAIFSLPQVTFAHYGAGLKSSILIMRKRKDGEKKYDNKVFSAIIHKVGYDGVGRADKTDIPDIIKKYKSYLKGKDYYDDDVFVKKISEFNNNRLDPYYYSPMFEKIIKKIKKLGHKLLPLSKITVDIFNGKTPAKDDYSENSSDPKIVKVATLKKGVVNFDFVEFVKPDAVSEKYLEEGDILILSSAHQADYLGKNPCVVEIPEELKEEDFVFVGELINIRAKKDIVNPYYLLQLFNTHNYYLLINREKRGQTSHLYPSDMKKILIPVPDKTIQDRNAQEYIKNHKRYMELIKKADDLLEGTFQKFEDDFLKE